MNVTRSCDACQVERMASVKKVQGAEINIQDFDRVFTLRQIKVGTNLCENSSFQTQTGLSKLTKIEQ